MKKKLLVALIILLSGVSVTYASDVNVYSWSDLKNNRKNLSNNYFLKNNTTPSGIIYVGTNDSSTKGYWNLDGENRTMNGNYTNSKFFFQNNISSFVFKNMNFIHTKVPSSTDITAGFLHNKGKGGQILSSVFDATGAIYGGTIYNDSGAEIVLIDGTTFKNAFVNNGQGGVIFNSSNAYISTIQNSDFISNGSYTASSSSNGRGGAIYNDTNATINLISNTNFGTENVNSSGNRANRDGGAIYNLGSINKITGSSFYYNGNEVQYRNGGAIYNDSTGVIKEISSSTFDNNGVYVSSRQECSYNGGAIYNMGTIGDAGENTGIVDTTFSNNTAASFGGAIYNMGTIGTDAKGIENTIFNKNTGVNGGGAIYNADNSSIPLIKNSTFTDNASTAALTEGGGRGGAINNWSGTIKLISNSNFGKEDDTLSGNRSYNGGGAIYNNDNLGTITNSKFYYNGNINSARGGAIYNADSHSIDEISSSTFGHNGIKIDSRQDWASFGGAIYNQGKIGTETKGITNTTFDQNASKNGGGAIYNSEYGGAISFIEDSTFTKNYSGIGGGGAIFNGNKISKINRTLFEENRTDTVLGGDYFARGAAIYNYQNSNNTTKIDEITNSEFYLNSTTDFGGAIANSARIDKISNDTFGSATKGNTAASGGAINNQDSGTIGEISHSTFAGNVAEEPDNHQQGHGGAIRNYNNAKIEKINNVTFTSNSALSMNNKTLHSDYTAKGGAIFNENNSSIELIQNSKFENNVVNAGHSTSYKGHSLGGAIHNGTNSSIDLITNTEFKGNSAQGSNAYGGAIFNSTEGNGITKIKGASYTNNYTKSLSAGGFSLGGAVFTQKANITFEADGSSDDTKTVTFSGNYSEASDGTKTQNAFFIDSTYTAAGVTFNSINGGKIQSDDEIDGGKITSGVLSRNGEEYNLTLTGDNNSSIILNNKVINGSATLTNTNLTIGLTSSNSSDVFADSNTALNATSGNISFIDDKISNYNINKLVSSDTNWTIDTNFSNETADTITLTDTNSSGTVKISAIKNAGTITQPIKEEYKIQVIKGANGDTTSANVQLNIDNLSTYTIDKETPYYTDVYSDSVIGDVDTTIYLATTDTLNDSLGIKGTIYDNLKYIAELVPLYGENKTFTIRSTVPNYSYSAPALNVVGDLTITGLTKDTSSIDFTNNTDVTFDTGAKVTINNIEIKNSKSITNNADLTSNNAKYTNITTLTNNKNATFTNVSFDTVSDKIVNNATGSDSMTFNGTTKINSSVENNGNLEFKGNTALNGEIKGAPTNAKLKLSTGITNVNNKISNQEITNSGSTTNIADISYVSDNNNKLIMESGAFNLSNLGLNTVNFASLSLNGGEINIASTDVDLQTKTMGRIKASSYGALGSGIINVNGINVISDSKDGTTPVLFADNAIKGAVRTSITEAYGPVYKYNINYNKSGKYGSGGYFVFERPSNSTLSSSPNASGYNPSVLIVPVANTAVGQVTMNQTFNYAFEHMDTFSKYPTAERYALINSNLYAISENIQNKEEKDNSRVWLKPYTAFDRINLNHGPKVDSISYGTLIGYDTDFKRMKRGWHRAESGYICYMGSVVDYNMVDMVSNGGILGFVENFYKDNFFTAITLATGVSSGIASSLFGHENYTSLMSGVGSKTGYNFEFKNGRYIIQPSLFVGYTFIKTFDYTNSAGAKINSNPYHSIQVNPNVRFIMNTESGWQPYLSVGMYWNLLNENKVKANNILLPSMSVKSYVEYGLGVQKKWKDSFIAYGQAIVRNGGRNGVALTFGLSYLLGGDAKAKKESL